MRGSTVSAYICCTVGTVDRGRPLIVTKGRYLIVVHMFLFL